MLFQYIGDADAPETTTIYDYYFELRGEPVEVTNPYHIEKLKNNGSFLWDKGEVTPIVPAPEPVVGTEEPVIEEVVEASNDDTPKKKKAK